MKTIMGKRSKKKMGTLRKNQNNKKMISKATQMKEFRKRQKMRFTHYMNKVDTDQVASRLR